MPLRDLFAAIRNHKRSRSLTGLLLLLILALAGLVLASPLAAQDTGREVLLLNAEGPVTPAMLSYLERGVVAGEERGIPLLVTLNTPGGSVAITQDIIRLFRNARVPVLVYVSPAGAQAASAGSLITLSAHASGMAPETVIGAASPVSGEGQDIEETRYRKLVEDLKATVRGLAQRRGEEAVVLAEEMIEDARAVHAREALDVGLIDAVSDDVPAFLEAVDGLTVDVAGRTWTLQTAGAAQTPLGMSFVEGVLHGLSNPLLISILLPLGITAIMIELRSPGGWVAGFVGVMALGLAFYGLGQLPVNWLGLGLIAVAFVLFLLEVKAPGIGALALAGGGTLFAGLLLLFNSPSSPDFVRLSLPAAIAITVTTSAIFLFIVTMAVRAQRRQPATGREGLVGQTGRVRKTLVPAPSGPMRYAGTVLVHGELWRAEAPDALERDEEVVVTEVDGFTLHVSRKAA
jgi:membrane-bound serine protease (ClpP class)